MNKDDFLIYFCITFFGAILAMAFILDNNQNKRSFELSMASSGLVQKVHEGKVIWTKP